MKPLTRALLAGAAIFVQANAIAEERGHPTCDAIVQPDELETFSGHVWRGAPAIKLTGDIAVCAYYQAEAPAGLTLSVHEDPERQEFTNARQYYKDVQDAKDLRDAYYFRLASSAPFAPSWGLIAHEGKRTYRLEGVPEAGKADVARKMAREIIERTMKVF